VKIRVVVEFDMDIDPEHWGAEKDALPHDVVGKVEAMMDDDPEHVITGMQGAEKVSVKVKF